MIGKPFLICNAVLKKKISNAVLGYPCGACNGHGLFSSSVDLQRMLISGHWICTWAPTILHENYHMIISLLIKKSQYIKRGQDWTRSKENYMVKVISLLFAGPLLAAVGWCVYLSLGEVYPGL